MYSLFRKKKGKKEKVIQQSLVVAHKANTETGHCPEEPLPGVQDGAEGDTSHLAVYKRPCSSSHTSRLQGNKSLGLWEESLNLALHLEPQGSYKLKAG